MFDFYYLINDTKLDKDKLYNCIKLLIIDDDTMKEKSICDIVNRLKITLNSNIYKANLTNPKVNWLNVPINDTIKNIMEYLESLETIFV